MKCHALRSVCLALLAAALNLASDRDALPATCLTKMLA